MVNRKSVRKSATIGPGLICASWNKSFIKSKHQKMVDLFLVLLYCKYLFKIGLQTIQKTTKVKLIFVLLNVFDKETIFDVSLLWNICFTIFWFFKFPICMLPSIQSLFLLIRKWENKNKNKTTNTKVWTLLFLFLLTLTELQNLFLVNLKTCADLCRL